MQWKHWIAGALIVASLSACGRTLGEQAVLGGGTGAIAGAVTGGDPLAGAAIGAAGNVAFCQLNPHRCR